MARQLDKAPDTSGIDPSTFLRLYREIRAARTPMETAVGVYRNARKKAKAAGMDEFALSIMERLVKMEAEGAGVALRNLFKYAGWTNVDLGVSQGDLFDAAPEQAPTDDATAAYREQVVLEAGIAAGRAGQKIDDNPHHAGTAQHVAWVKGWHQGQADAVMTAFGKPKPGAATRRARNPKAETRDILSDTAAKLDEEPKAEEDAGAVNALGNLVAPLAAESQQAEAADNVFPIEARRGRPKKAAVPAANKASAKAAKAAAKLAGEPVVEPQPADFTGGATAF